MRASILLSTTITALAVAGCTPATVVNTDESGAPTEAAPPPPPPAGPPPSNAYLLDAFDYGAPVDGRTRYYFTTPSGRWECGIVARERAGCEAASGTLSITGAPETVPGATGEPTAPTAILVDRDGDAGFVATDVPEFGLDPGPANVLPFNRILAVGGFRCNVQEAVGISCLSERSGRGFSFSDEGFAPQYTDIPPGVP